MTQSTLTLSARLLVPQQGGQNAPLVPPTAPDAGTPVQGAPGGEPGQSPSGGGDPLAGCFGNQFVFLIAIVAIFYFLIIRPQSRQEKARKAMLAAIKQGDEVVTSSGLHGTIAALSEQTVKLRVAKDLTLTFDRSAVARRVADESAAEKKP